MSLRSDMHCRCRSGAPMEYLSHKTSHDGNCSYLTPSHCGTKHLGQLTSGALALRPEVRSTQTSSAARSMSSNYEGFRYPLAATHERTAPSAAFMVGNLTWWRGHIHCCPVKGGCRSLRYWYERNTQELLCCATAAAGNELHPSASRRSSSPGKGAT
jgi:hypothetical protein